VFSIFKKLFGANSSTETNLEEKRLEKVVKKRTVKKKRPNKKKKRPKPKERGIDIVSDYKIKGDGSTIDSVVQFLHSNMDVKPDPRIEVSGFCGKSTKQGHKAYQNMFKRKDPEYGYLVKTIWIRFVYPKNELENDPYEWDKLFTDEFWGEDFDLDILKDGYKRAVIPVEKALEGKRHKSVISLGVAYSWGAWRYLSFAVDVQLTPRDLFDSCWKERSDFVTSKSEEVLNELEKRILEDGALVTEKIFESRHSAYELFRDIENYVRRENGYPAIGDSWVNETLLFDLIKSHYEDAIREYSPDWLGMQRLDIYIPSLMIAIEYQGEQHYQPISFFGGEEGLEKRRSLDSRKKRLCEENKVTLLEWHYSVSVTKASVDKFILDNMRRVD